MLSLENTRKLENMTHGIPKACYGILESLSFDWFRGSGTRALVTLALQTPCLRTLANMVKIQITGKAIKV